MKTEQRILTRKLTSKQHYETLVVIDWAGVTQEQLMTMAQWAIIHELQARYAKGDMEIPEKERVSAVEVAKEKPVMLLKFSPPPSRPIKLDKQTQALFDTLTKEELLLLLGS